jgi:hypothetical protein
MQPGDTEAAEIQLEQGLGVLTLAELARQLGWPVPRTQVALTELLQRGRVREADPTPESKGEPIYVHVSRPPRTE